MFCKNCGSEILENEKCCAACGAPAPQPQAQAPDAQGYEQPAQPQYAPQQPQYAPQQPQYAPQQPQYAPQPQYYGAPVKSGNDGSGFSAFALVLGICGIFFSFVPYANFFFIVAAIAGIILAVVGRKKSAAVNGGFASGLSTAGLVLSVIATVFCTFGIVFWVSIGGLFESAIDNYNDYMDDIYDYSNNFDYGDYDDLLDNLYGY